MPNDDSDLLKAILDGATTRSYAQYVSNEFAVEKEQIELGKQLEKQVLDKFVDHIAENHYILGSVPKEKLDWAREQLFGGFVMGVDGRRDKPTDIISGVFCEIGIAGVTYKTLSSPELACYSITSHLKESLNSTLQSGDSPLQPYCKQNKKHEVEVQNRCEILRNGTMSRPGASPYFVPWTKIIPPTQAPRLRQQSCPVPWLKAWQNQDHSVLNG